MVKRKNFIKKVRNYLQENIKGNKDFEIINGKGNIKEYNINNELIFEGEYINGEKHKGKEYNNKGKIIFEGEYLNNKRKKGKEYKIINDINKLNFEGEYLNDEKWT